VTSSFLKAEQSGTTHRVSAYSIFRIKPLISSTVYTHSGVHEYPTFYKPYKSIITKLRSFAGFDLPLYRKLLPTIFQISSECIFQFIRMRQPFLPNPRFIWHMSNESFIRMKWSAHSNVFPTSFGSKHIYFRISLKQEIFEIYIKYLFNK